MRPLLLALILCLCASGEAAAYRVKSGLILDAQNRVIKLQGISWFGFETGIHTAHGLWARNHVELIRQIHDAGFNAVRLPLCPDSIHGAKVEGLDAGLNPELAGKNSLAVLDVLINEMAAQNIMVLLDHHRPDCESQSELWYTAAYSETQWINDLVSLAQRYRNQGNVLGIDIKNEPHGAATWGSGDKTTDFNLAAERAAAAVLKEAPQWLIFVEGIGQSGICSSSSAHFWGENIEPIDCAPLNIPRQQLVLSPHVYGPDIANMPYFGDAQFPANMPSIWDAHFGRMALRGYAVVPGEFGGGYGHCATAADRVWQNAFVQYLISRGMGSAFYWSLNPNSNQTGGLLQDGWKTFWPDKLALLQSLHSNGAKPLPPPLGSDEKAKTCSEAKPAETTAAHVIGPPPPPALGSDVGSFASKPLAARPGLRCTETSVRNDSGSPIRWQQQIDAGGDAQLISGARFDAPIKGRQMARGVGSSATLAPGESARFSYCQTLAPATGARPAPAIAIPMALPAQPATPPGNAASAPLAAAVNPAPAQAGPVVTGAGFLASEKIDSDWAKGYCATVQVRNDSAAPANWKASLTLNGSLRQIWKARAQVTGKQLTAEGEDYNRTLKPGEATDFGYCVDK